MNVYKFLLLNKKNEVKVSCWIGWVIIIGCHIVSYIKVAFSDIIGMPFALIDAVKENQRVSVLGKFLKKGIKSFTVSGLKK